MYYIINKGIVFGVYRSYKEALKNNINNFEIFYSIGKTV